MVLFGENVPAERAAAAVAPLADDGGADGLLVLGSSLQVCACKVSLFTATQLHHTSSKHASIYWRSLVFSCRAGVDDR